MSRGFIFDQTLCVNCKSCSAACLLENNFKIKPRIIISNNPDTSLKLPVEHLSIACNHCEIPVCLYGCPVSAYYRDPATDAIILDGKKCIGCMYCNWNCPFDAPKYDPSERIAGKCHLCYTRTGTDLLPACSSACPTGALSFGTIDEYDSTIKPEWLPGSELNPSIRFKEKLSDIPLKIFPESLFGYERKNPLKSINILTTEWSLVLFSFIAMLSVSLISASVIKGVLPDKAFFITISFLPGLISFFHLGKIFRAWRVFANIKRSPLSREISLYVIYLLVSCYSVISEIPWMLVCSSLIGLIFLFSIDSVYFYTAKSIRIFLHSGQTLLSALLIISLLSDSILPFTFIALIKVSFSVYGSLNKSERDENSVIRILSTGILIIGGAGFVSGKYYPKETLVILIIGAEFLNRILFYIDFEPDSIVKIIDKHIKKKLNEKE